MPPMPDHPMTPARRQALVDMLQRMTPADRGILLATNTDPELAALVRELRLLVEVDPVAAGMAAPSE